MSPFAGSLVASLVIVCLSLVGTQGALIGEEVCAYIESSLQCDSTPCGCEESELNCGNCQSTQGCAQCSGGYFKTGDSGEKCVACAMISGCEHCTDTTGCQQCESGCTPSQSTTSCGIRTCDCGDEEPAPLPTDKPTSRPTDRPTTAMPTATPVSLGEQIEGLREEFDSFWTSDDPAIIEAMEDYYTDDVTVCWGGFGCGGLSTLTQFAGVCDAGSISTFSDKVFQDDRVIYSWYRACHNEYNDFGLFWINGVGITKYTDQGLIEEFTVNFRDLDVLQPYLEAYLAGTTLGVTP